MKRTILRLFLFGTIAIMPMLNGTTSVGAKSAVTSSVTAFARCVDATASDPAQVEVAIDNNSGGPIRVSYVHGFTTGQALNPKFSMHKPGSTPTYIVENGDRFWVWAPWDDLREKSEIGAALIVTNLGLLIPDCSGESSGIVNTRSNRAAGVGLGDTELATIAAETIGMLETWHAYPALYALLHPDSQAEASFETVACWYANAYGLPDAWTQTVFTTEVHNVEHGIWTYPVTGDTYDTSAEVTYSQQIGTMSASSNVDGVEHLVPYEGQYRWFFGLDASWIAAQPDDCDLGN